jgi:hypothetical protein
VVRFRIRGMPVGSGRKHPRCAHHVFDAESVPRACSIEDGRNRKRRQACSGRLKHE